MLKKYTVTITEVVSYQLEVKAENAEEAREIGVDAFLAQGYEVANYLGVQERSTTAEEAS